MSHPHLELHTLHSQLRSIHSSMASFASAQLAAKPPILDASIDLTAGDINEEFRSHQDAVHGLRALQDAVKKDLNVLGKFLDDPECASLPPLSTNAPYLISVWNEVLHAPPPIVSIWRTFFEGKHHVPRRGSCKPPGVKVDVVADSGRRWIRVNTTTNSRLIAEFRELDSYLTDSEDEEEENIPTLAQRQLDNSILRMGRALLEAARRNPIADTTELPSIVIRLTRLDPAPSDSKKDDPRIVQTIDTLRNMGIAVELGERDLAQLPKLSPSPSKVLEPTIHINLDLSVLIAFISDITHDPPPTSTAEADARYVPSIHYREWKRKRLESIKRIDGDIEKSHLVQQGIGTHSRALAHQSLQEMKHGLLQDLHDCLAVITSNRLENVEFWTTPDARDRCLRVVSKIGGPHEKQRATALFPDEGTSLSIAEESYWDTSRYPRGFLPLIPIRVFASSMPPADLVPPPVAHDAPSDPGWTLSPFFSLLARKTRAILAQEAVPPAHLVVPPATSRSSSESSSSSSSYVSASSQGVTGDDDEDEDIERATVTKANPRLTTHTVQSMLWGAARGWTTLTANKSSVKAILRDIGAGEVGYAGWCAEGARETCVDGDVDAGVDGVESKEQEREKAALWVVGPKSLAEGMRFDYQERLVS